MKINKSVLQRWLFPVLLVLVLSACVSRSTDNFLAENSASVMAVGHLGRMVGIPEFYVNGDWGGGNGGWGGGGGTVCCVSLGNVQKQPVMVTVKWKTCDVSHIKFVNDRAVEPGARCISEWHETTVPVHFVVPLGDGSGLKIHFLPGNKVEAWYTRGYPEGTKYPGPAYPRGPAPDYASLPDQKTIPAKELQP